MDGGQRGLPYLEDNLSLSIVDWPSSWTARGCQYFSVCSSGTVEVAGRLDALLPARVREGKRRGGMWDWIRHGNGASGIISNNGMRRR
jgi:hypothetical protein